MGTIDPLSKRLKMSHNHNKGEVGCPIG